VRRVAQVAAVLLVALLPAACSALAEVTPAPTETITGESGIRGIVLLGPTCGANTGGVPGTDDPIATPVPVGTFVPIDSIPPVETLGPVETPGVAPTDPAACVTPYVAQLVILDRENHEVATVTSGQDGRFEVRLPPGDYTVTPVVGDPYPTAVAQAVSVSAGEFTEIGIDYDSGIR
jgi:hypothetical protein